MSEIEPSSDNSLDKPVTARDILAAVVDVFALDGIPVSSRAKGMLGKQAKELLADGFDPDVLLRASVAAYCRAQPAIMHLLAVEITTAEAGKHLSPREWREKVNSYKAQSTGPSITEQLIQSVYDRKQERR